MNQREILFRGKRVDTLEWVEGFFLQRISLGKLISYIQKGPHNTIYEVIPETVSQYVGLKDKNGVKIFEGDKVIAWSEGVKGEFIIKWRQEGGPCYILYPAWQEKKFWTLSATKHEKGKQFINLGGQIYTPDKEGYYDDGVEVIGNIFEEK